MAMPRRFASLLLGILFVTVSPFLASASYIDFTGAGGYAGGGFSATLYNNNTFAGKGAVNNVYGGLTDKNSGIQTALTNGYYVFSTGNLGAGGGGGTFELYGGIADANIPVGTKLAWGTFTSSSLKITPLGAFQFTAAIKDEKLGALVDFYYLVRPTAWIADLQAQGPGIPLGLAVNGTISSAFVGDSRIPQSRFLVASSDLMNQPVSVPEPGSMFLLGSGLVCLAGWGRKLFRS